MSGRRGPAAQIRLYRLSEAEAVPRAPSRRALLAEARTALDILKMMRLLGRLHASGPAKQPVDCSPVMVLPGYGSDDRSTAPLRHFLRRKGLSVEGWGLGMNCAGLNLSHGLADISQGWELPPKTPYRGEAGVAYLSDRVAERVLARSKTLGRPLSLVGWSLGGTIAREVARDCPRAVDRVITLGSPVIGGPKYTAAARRLRAQGLDLDWIETQVARRERTPIRQPVTSIFSRSDGIVSWTAAIDRHSPRVKHVEVDAAHIGMGFNPVIWQLVVDALLSPFGDPAQDI